MTEFIITWWLVLLFYSVQYNGAVSSVHCTLCTVLYNVQYSTYSPDHTSHNVTQYIDCYLAVDCVCKITERYTVQYSIEVEFGKI